MASPKYTPAELAQAFMEVTAIDTDQGFDEWRGLAVQLGGPAMERLLALSQDVDLAYFSTVMAMCLLPVRNLYRRDEAEAIYDAVDDNIRANSGANWERLADRTFWLMLKAQQLKAGAPENPRADPVLFMIGELLRSLPTNGDAQVRALLGSPIFLMSMEGHFMGRPLVMWWKSMATTSGVVLS